MCSVLHHSSALTFHSQWAKENDLVLEAYSPLGSNNQVKETLNVPEVQAIAKELGITPAQAIISWHVQRGVRSPHRIVGRIYSRSLPDRLWFCRRASPRRAWSKTSTVSLSDVFTL